MTRPDRVRLPGLEARPLPAVYAPPDEVFIDPFVPEPGALFCHETGDHEACPRSRFGIVCACGCHTFVEPESWRR